MVFSSVIFLFVFLSFTLAVYFLLKIEYRNVFLLLVSLFFYAWGEPVFVFVMLVSIVLNYIGGLLVAYAKEKKSAVIQRFVITIIVILNLSLIGYFKYFDFLAGILNLLPQINIPLRNIVLPVGISFFTFQGMSYPLDVFMGTSKVQRNFINLALYVAFFPQLIAGPIVRYHDIDLQLTERKCSISKFYEGIRRFIIGLAKKVIIANQLGLVADSIFNASLSETSFSIAWVGIICYTLQIYFDFSGYSCMAIGLAKMFGFDFLENFNYPYIAKSLTEFWRRWHISLSTWFRDYVYIPMGGNRKGNVFVHLWIVFFLTGLWHGAAWNFVIWGLWHGLFLVIERLVKKHNIILKIPPLVKWMYTMLIVIIGWVLFRSPDLSYAFQYLKIMFGFDHVSGVGFTVFWYLTPKVIFVLLIAVLASIDWKQRLAFTSRKIEEKPSFILASNLSLLLFFFLSIIAVITSTYNPFIYFRF